MSNVRFPNFKCGHLRDEANTYWSSFVDKRTGNRIPKPQCRQCSIDRSKATWRNRHDKKAGGAEFCFRCLNHEGKNCAGGCFRVTSSSEDAKACRCGVAWSLMYPRELEATRSVFIVHTGAR